MFLPHIACWDHPKSIHIADFEELGWETFMCSNPSIAKVDLHVQMWIICECIPRCLYRPIWQLMLSYDSKEGFHVMSYQANFARHHTQDHHVGFLFTQSSIRKYNKMSCYFLFSSYHNTKLQLSDKNIISTHIRLKFVFFLWSKSKVQAFFVFHYTAPYKNMKKETKRQSKIVCVWVHTASCKPSIGVVEWKSGQVAHASYMCDQEYKRLQSWIKFSIWSLALLC